jgi:hypothetical protein
MKPKVYLETSVVSYLTAYQSRDVIVLARQQITEDWWKNHRQNYELFTSDVVEQEACLGNALMSKKRLNILKTLESLATSENAVELAETLVKRKAVPENSAADALHIAIATIEKMNFLLTWNFKHIANAQMQSKIEKVCKDEGWQMVTICTPESLLGE